MINLLLKELEKQGITNSEVLATIKKIPREKFVTSEYKKRAYENIPLPIEQQQTISQPYIVASMTQILIQPPRPNKVLEIGTGSGYQTAILASLFNEVYTIERIPTLLEKAKNVLSNLNFKNIHFKCGDGSKGWADFAPFDAIIVTAAAESLPKELTDQLSSLQGKLLIPLGPHKKAQELTLITRNGDKYKKEVLENVIFVPLIAKE